MHEYLRCLSFVYVFAVEFILSKDGQSNFGFVLAIVTSPAKYFRSGVEMLFISRISTYSSRAVRIEVTYFSHGPVSNIVAIPLRNFGRLRLSSQGFPVMDITSLEAGPTLISLGRRSSFR